MPVRVENTMPDDLNEKMASQGEEVSVPLNAIDD